MVDHAAADKPTVPPLTPGLVPNLKFDLVSGFLVFLIALPLCLGIAAADHFPAITGVWTAVLGGLITTFISNSQMTIKGPAAGLIVIVLGAVSGFEADIAKERLNPNAGAAEVTNYLDNLPQSAEGGQASKDEVRALAYRNALGVAVVAGIIQILFGLFRAGILAEICPMTPVHALLASIGIVIMFKQAYPLLGILKSPGGEAINAVIGLPEYLPKTIPNVAIVGLVGLAIMIIWSFVTNKSLKKIPAQVVVLLVCVPLSLALGLGKEFLVPMPNVLSNPAAAFGFPLFDRLLTSTGVMYIVLFALIGSLESLVSAKAVDLIDPWKRKTDLNRDMLAIGLANTAGAFIGAPPMISEIVRSKANIDNGARTKFADLYHSVFLLLAAVFLSTLLAYIPMAALAAMLVFTGFRLAHPREFISTYKIGPEQLIVFLVTIGVILATDLLIGFFAGIATEMLFHLINGVSPKSFLTSDVEVLDVDAERLIIRVRGSAVFSNWLGLRGKLLDMKNVKEVIVDLSDTKLVDHSTMEKLHEFERELKAKGKLLTLRGLESHRPLSSHPAAARKR